MSSDKMELVCVYLLIPFLLNGTELGLQLLLLLSTVHNLFNLSGMSAVGPVCTRMTSLTSTTCMMSLTS